jgi:hypothetical protein
MSILLEIEKGYNKYMEEEDYIHSTLLQALTHCCCNSLFLSYSLHTLTFSLSLSLQNHASFIGKYGELLQHIFQHGGDNKAIKHGTNGGIKYSTKHSGGALPQNGNFLRITPFAIYVGNCPLASSAQACILQLFQAYHSKSVFNTTFLFELINHARSGMIFQALHQGLQHPLKRIFPSATVIEYFNVITSSPLFHESTHPGVAPALCSTLGTTPYFSVSLSLVVLALHL